MLTFTIYIGIFYHLRCSRVETRNIYRHPVYIFIPQFLTTSMLPPLKESVSHMDMFIQIHFMSISTINQINNLVKTIT